MAPRRNKRSATDDEGTTGTSKKALIAPDWDQLCAGLSRTQLNDIALSLASHGTVKEIERLLKEGGVKSKAASKDIGRFQGPTTVIWGSGQELGDRTSPTSV